MLAISCVRYVSLKHTSWDSLVNNKHIFIFWKELLFVVSLKILFIYNKLYFGFSFSRAVVLHASSLVGF